MIAQGRTGTASPERESKASRLQRARPFQPEAATRTLETEASRHPESAAHTSEAPTPHAFGDLSVRPTEQPVQRYTAIKDNYNKVFVPPGKKPSDSAEQAIYETSLKALVPGGA